MKPDATVSIPFSRERIQSGNWEEAGHLGSYHRIPNAHQGSSSLREWFTEVISPTFQDPEARYAVTASARGLSSPLADAHERIQKNTERFNTPRAAKLSTFSFSQRAFSPLSSGSLRACSSALVSSALGTGILSLPFAFSLVGVGLGLAMLTFSGFVAALSLQVIIMGARYTESDSYASLLQLATGRPSAATAVDITVLLLCAGAISCYLVFEGDFLPALFTPVPGVPTPSREASIVGVSLLAWPLCLQSELSALHFVTVASPLVLLATTLVVVMEAPSRFEDMTLAGGKVALWDFDPSKFMQSASIMLTSFTNQQIAVTAGNQLTEPSVARIVKTTVNASVLIWGILALVGIGGYLSWLGATQGNFITNYPQDSKPIWFCRAMLAVCLYCVTPVVCLPCSNAVYKLYAKARGMPSTTKPSALVHSFCATSVLIATTVTAILCSNVASLIGIIGSLCATNLMFVFPAIIFVKVLWPVQPRYVRTVVIAVLVLCALCGITALCMNIRQIVIAD